MKINSKDLLSWLLFVWFPLSCGNIVFLEYKIGPLTLQNIIILFFYFLAFFVIASSKKRLFIDKGLMFFTFYIFISGIILSQGALSFLLKFGSLIGVTFLAWIITEKIAFEQFISICLKSSLFFTLLALLFGLFFPQDAFDTLQNRQVFSSFYIQKNTLGRFLYMAFFFFSISYLFIKKSQLGLLLVPVIFYSLVLTESRTSMLIAILIFLLLKFIITNNRVIKNFHKGVLIGSAVLPLLFLSNLITFYNVGSIFDGINVAGITIGLTGRATIWNAIFTNMETINALFGYGMDVYFNNYDFHFRNIGLGDFVPNDSHNGYVDLFVNVGIVGCFLYSALIGSYIKRAIRNVNYTLSVSALSFLVIFLLTNFTESFFIKTSNITSFLFLIFYFYLQKNAKQKE